MLLIVGSAVRLRQARRAPPRRERAALGSASRSPAPARSASSSCGSARRVSCSARRPHRRRPSLACLLRRARRSAPGSRDVAPARRRSRATALLELSAALAGAVLSWAAFSLLASRWCAARAGRTVGPGRPRGGRCAHRGARDGRAVGATLADDSARRFARRRDLVGRAAVPLYAVNTLGGARRRRGDGVRAAGADQGDGLLLRGRRGERWPAAVALAASGMRRTPARPRRPPSRTSSPPRRSCLWLAARGRSGSSA